MWGWMALGFGIVASVAAVVVTLPVTGPALIVAVYGIGFGTIIGGCAASHKCAISAS
jgi:tetrahydromethanopterin S-methyltransferase subunit C